MAGHTWIYRIRVSITIYRIRAMRRPPRLRVCLQSQEAIIHFLWFVARRASQAAEINMFASTSTTGRNAIGAVRNGEAAGSAHSLPIACSALLACRWPKRQSKAVHVCSRVLPGNSGGGAALSALNCTHVLCAPMRFVRPDGHIVPRHRPHVHSTFSSRGRLRCPMAMPLLTSFVPRV